MLRAYIPTGERSPQQPTRLLELAHSPWGSFLQRHGSAGMGNLSSRKGVLEDWDQEDAARICLEKRADGWVPDSVNQSSALANIMGHPSLPG